MSQRNKRSFNSKKRGKNLEPIPTDLITEIISRLSAKSIARFRCVSKLWESMLHRPYFTELFLTRSRARPRILFTVQGQGEWSFYSSPQHNPYEKSSSLVLDANFQMKFSRSRDNMWISGSRLYDCGYASGLIYFPNMFILKENDQKRVIFNPNTGQYAILPKQISYRKLYSFLGFDPIDKQFKVLLVMGYAYGDNDHRILTLGTGELRWRTIQCPLIHEPSSGGICISGILYYLAREIDRTPVIVCFNVRSEKFKFIHVDWFPDPLMYELINYNGKLGGISSRYANADGIELRIWVLEDVEKHEFSKHVYTLPENKMVDVSVVGMTTRGEIVLAMEYTFKPFYVFYFNLERNTLHRVEIQGFGTNLEAFGSVYAVVDHVEDLNVNDAKLLKSSILAPSVKNKTKTTTSGRGKRKGQGQR